MNGGLKVFTKLEEFTINIEVTSARNISTLEVSTYSRTHIKSYSRVAPTHLDYSS